MAMNSTSSSKIKVNFKQKQQDNINHTKVGKGHALVKRNFSSHIITLPMETDRFGHVSAKMGPIMKSMANGDFFIENKRNFLPISLHYLWKQRPLWSYMRKIRLMKSMAMVDFFIENKKNRDLVHYLRKWVNNEIHGNSRASSLKIKGTFFPYHYITYGKIMRHALNPELSSHITTLPTYGKRTLFGPLSRENGSDNEIPWLWLTSSLKKKELFFPYHYITYGSGDTLWLGTFFPYHYITYGSRNAALVIICENGLIMKSMAIIDFFIENKRNILPLSLHYL
ncbi:hypothetical protein H6P81_021555 [Aristolochia fimbriata]|uniref:Uncharacterized protein n=1 Tax=Aristolochia fimbriata TaxID=158543 RepID=A0AAV7DQJ5_ARIFI|nr:hypothetical protein H6P81_021555 [Aristolochia fimbriata]